MATSSTRFWFMVPLLIAACGGSDAGGEAPLDDGAGQSGVSAGAPAGTAGSAGSAGSANGTSGASARAGAGGTVNGAAGAPTQGTAGASNTAGAAGKSGSAGSSAGGSTGTAGANGGAGAGGGSTVIGPSPSCKAWPAATGSTQKLTATKKVSGSFDGKLQRFVGDGALGSSGQDEGQPALFELADGATLENVIIGSPAADGVHCKGSCTLKNVWWEDVGEDAATFAGSSASQVMTIDCGGAKNASDKVLQHNGPGTMKISNFYVATFGKLYRSCGNCSDQYARHVEITGISAKGGKSLVGVNENYKDSAILKNLLVSSGTVICQKYKGNSSGDEPTTTNSTADGKVCIYQASDVHPL